MMFARYRLIDYFYTAFHQAHLDGTPVLHPLWHKYPQDPATFPVDLQFFFGDSILVSPVTEENATSVTAYFPKDTFYDFLTLAPFEGSGANVTLSNINFTSIPVHIRGGVVLPLRSKGAMTTTVLRKTDFELVVAPDANDEASGALYADDGVSITQNATTTVTLSYKQGVLTVKGNFGYALGVNVARVRFLNVRSAPKTVGVDGVKVNNTAVSYDKDVQVLDVTLNTPFSKDFTVQYS
jgi:alpha-glucosidase